MLIDITNTTDAELSSILGVDVTPEEVVAALASEGLTARVEWRSGTYASVGVTDGGRTVAVICIDGRAKVLTKERIRLGHGLARLSSHPLYPAPIESPLVAKMLRACAIANGP